MCRAASSAGIFAGLWQPRRFRESSRADSGSSSWLTSGRGPVTRKVPIGFDALPHFVGFALIRVVTNAWLTMRRGAWHTAPRDDDSIVAPSRLRVAAASLRWIASGEVDLAFFSLAMSPGDRCEPPRVVAFVQSSMLPARTGGPSPDSCPTRRVRSIGLHGPALRVVTHLCWRPRRGGDAQQAL